MNSGNVPNDVKVMMMKGEKGDDAVSPALSETAITGGHRVTMVDAEGTTTFDVMDGVSPTLEEEAINNGYRVTMTDANGTSTFDLHNATSGDYQGLTNKPSINGVEIYGAKTSADYKLIGAGTIWQVRDSDSVTIPANTEMWAVFELPAAIDLDSNAYVLGIPRMFVASSDCVVQSWEFQRDGNNRWALWVYLRNLTSQQLTDVDVFVTIMIAAIDHEP